MKKLRQEKITYSKQVVSMQNDSLTLKL